MSNACADYIAGNPQAKLRGDWRQVRNLSQKQVKRRNERWLGAAMNLSFLGDLMWECALLRNGLRSGPFGNEV